MSILNKKLPKQGFTLIELLVVIAIIGILSTLAIVAFGNSRIRARDGKRLADMKQLSTALSLYYNENKAYPTMIVPGQPLASPDGKTVYIGKIPSNPAPRNDGSCGGSDYAYGASYKRDKYRINFCLGVKANDLPAGHKYLTSTGIIDFSPNPDPSMCGGYKEGYCPGKKDCVATDIDCGGGRIYSCLNFNEKPPEIKDLECREFGKECRNDKECTTLFCNEGLCDTYENGVVCEINESCANGLCVEGICVGKEASTPGDADVPIDSETPIDAEVPSAE